MSVKAPQNVFINDEMLVCNQCKGELFYSSKYDPGQSGLKLPGLEWITNSLDIFVCSTCGFVHCFASVLPTEMPRISVPTVSSDEKVTPENDPYGTSDTSECMACGRVIPRGKDRCPSCGWTYKRTTNEG